MTPTPVQDGPGGDGKPKTTPELQAALVEILLDLGELTGYVHDLADTHQPGLGFLSFQAKQALDRQTRSERADWSAAHSARAWTESLGLGHLKPLGESPTPGNFRSLASDADFTFTLLDAARRLTASLQREGKQLQVPPVVREPTATQLLWHVGTLVHLTHNAQLLRSLTRDLQGVQETAQALVHGNDRVLLEDPCPYCGNRSLVVYFADDLIKCDRDALTGQKAACTCPDPLCDCKQKPVAHRHVWYRSPTDKRKTPTDGTWSSLAGRLKFLRKAAAEPSKP